MPAPIILFVYNRPALTLNTLLALQRNDLANDSVLFIYADGPKSNANDEDLRKINETRQIIKKQAWCKKTIIKESATNRGLADSVIYGVTEILNQYECIIVLEDDLLTTTGFLQYMNTALTKYAASETVMQVSGFNFPIKTVALKKSYFLPFTTSWGWGTWRRAWKAFDANAVGYEILKSDKKLQNAFNLQGSYPYFNMLLAQMESKTIDSWAIRWWWSVFKHHGLVLYPDKTLVQNIGFGDGATHTSDKDDNLNSQLNNLNYSINFFPEARMVEGERFKQITKLLGDKNKVKKIERLVMFSKKVLKKINLLRKA